MKTSEQILRIASEIEDVLRANDLATPNPHAVNRLKFLASQLSGLDTYAAGKAHNIADRAVQFYSVRKHASYRGGSEQLYTDMRHDLLGRIRAQGAARQTAGD